MGVQPNWGFDPKIQGRYNFQVNSGLLIPIYVESSLPWPIFDNRNQRRQYQTLSKRSYTTFEVGL